MIFFSKKLQHCWSVAMFYKAGFFLSDPKSTLSVCSLHLTDGDMMAITVLIGDGTSNATWHGTCNIPLENGPNGARMYINTNTLWYTIITKLLPEFNLPKDLHDEFVCKFGEGVSYFTNRLVIR